MTKTTSAIEHLQSVGFGEYEARAYVTLVQHEPMTGYQLAKSSGIPRPNIYPVIDRLEKRGAITRIETGAGVKYAALPAEEMLARLSSSVESHLAGAGRALGDLPRADGADYAWNIDGYDNALLRAESLIGTARERLLVALWSYESAHLAEALASAQARGVHVVTLCIQGCAGECGNCRGDIYRYAVAGAAPAVRWLMLVADDRELLTCQVANDGETHGIQTSLEVAVATTAQYLRNTIAVAEIARSAGRRLPKLLDARAAGAVEGSGLATDGESWLARLTSVVRRSRA